MTPLLEAGLSGPVLAENVLPFLDRKSLLQLLSVDAIWEHFSLKNHYCRQHGTPLEYSDGCEQQEQQEEQDDYVAREWRRLFGAAADADADAAADKNDDSGGEDSSCTTIVTCEDCEQQKRGHKRCLKCDRFSLHIYFHTCDTCGRQGDCLSCDSVGWVGCLDCRKFFCNTQDCSPPIHRCRRCQQDYCKSCQDMVLCCSRCQKNLGCSSCATYRAIHCTACNKIYCSDCEQRRFYCVDCRAPFCQGCEQNNRCLSFAKYDHNLCGDCNNRTCGYCQRRHCKRCKARPCTICKQTLPNCDYCTGEFFCVTSSNTGPCFFWDRRLTSNTETDTAAFFLSPVVAQTFIPTKMYRCMHCSDNVCAKCLLAKDWNCNHCHRAVCSTLYTSCEKCQGPVCKRRCTSPCPDNGH